MYLSSYIKDSNAARTRIITGLNAERRVCLTGTPLQNDLNDLYSLVNFLKLGPWDKEKIWKHCMVDRVQISDMKAIMTLQLIMETISLRRLKSTILDTLPRKVQHFIQLNLERPWDQEYREIHEDFLMCFGRNRVQGQWDQARFFQQLNHLRQLCNHPALRETEENLRPTYRWQDSSKILMLIENLKEFFQNPRGILVPKAVVFSEFRRFLIMWVMYILSLTEGVCGRMKH